MCMIKRLALIIICFCFCTITSWAQEVMYEGENNGVLMLSVSEFNVKKKEAVAEKKTTVKKAVKEESSKTAEAVSDKPAPKKRGTKK